VLGEQCFEFSTPTEKKKGSISPHMMMEIILIKIMCWVNPSSKIPLTYYLLNIKHWGKKQHTVSGFLLIYTTDKPIPSDQLVKLHECIAP
jgi:hypothetical protein